VTLPPPSQHLPVAAGTVDTRFSDTVVAEAQAAARSAMTALRRDRVLMIVLYVALFAVGLGTAVAAVLRGFVAEGASEAVATVGIAGLSAASFFAFFLARPLEALERNAVHTQWLAAAVTAYWTRMAYFADAGTVDEDITTATRQLIIDLDRLARRHAEAIGRGAVPGFDPGAQGSSGLDARP
jgi:hypothetical protein